MFPAHVLDSCIGSGFVALRDERDDKALLHVSDLTGCELAVWSRRKGLPQRVADAPTLFSWESGHQYEETLYNALLAGLNAFYGGETIFAAERDVLLKGPRGIVGHADARFVLPDGRFIWECKSVKSYAYEKALREGPPSQYLMQAGTYADLDGSDFFAVTIVDRDKNRYKTSVHETAEVREASRYLVDAFAITTDPNMPEPPPLAKGDPRDWRCRGYCDFLLCERNTLRESV